MWLKVSFIHRTVWYELLCGEWPHKGLPPEAIIWQVGRGMKPSLANLQASRDVKVCTWALDQPFELLFSTIFIHSAPPLSASAGYTMETRERNIHQHIIYYHHPLLVHCLTKALLNVLFMSVWCYCTPSPGIFSEFINRFICLGVNGLAIATVTMIVHQLLVLFMLGPLQVQFSFFSIIEIIIIFVCS